MTIYLTTIACLSSDVIKGMCVPWGAFSSYAAEKGITSTTFISTYLVPMIIMVFCYARVIHTLRTKVTSTLSVCYKGKVYIGIDLIPKSLSTLSQKSETVAENKKSAIVAVVSPLSATVALFCDSVDRA